MPYIVINITIYLCTVPEPDITCADEKFTVRFERSKHPNLDEQHLTIPDGFSSGDCDYETSIDVNYVTIVIDYMSCGTVRTVSEIHVYKMSMKDKICKKRTFTLIRSIQFHYMNWRPKVS